MICHTKSHKSCMNKAKLMEGSNRQTAMPASIEHLKNIQTHDMVRIRNGHLTRVSTKSVIEVIRQLTKVCYKGDIISTSRAKIQLIENGDVASD